MKPNKNGSHAGSGNCSYELKQKTCKMRFTVTVSGDENAAVFVEMIKIQNYGGGKNLYIICSNQIYYYICKNN